MKIKAGEEYLIQYPNEILHIKITDFSKSKKYVQYLNADLHTCHWEELVMLENLIVETL